MSFFFFQMFNSNPLLLQLFHRLYVLFLLPFHILTLFFLPPTQSFFWFRKSKVNDLFLSKCFVICGTLFCWMHFNQMYGPSMMWLCHIFNNYFLWCPPNLVCIGRDSCERKYMCTCRFSPALKCFGAFKRNSRGNIPFFFFFFLGLFTIVKQCLLNSVKLLQPGSTHDLEVQLHIVFLQE